MKECIQPYYLKDGDIYDCGSFHTGLIDEGKSIYEVARLAGTQLLFLGDHIERLFTSLKLEGLESWLSNEEIINQLDQLIRKNPVKEGNVKFVLNFRSRSGFHFLAYFVEHRYPSDEDYLNGVKVITFPFERPEPNKKVWRPGFRREVAEAIRQNNAFEALLLDSKKSLPEASKANFFAIRGDSIITPPDKIILPGVTRKYVLKACSDLDIPVIMRNIRLDELKDMDGLFLTGTSLHVLPVSQVDELRFSTGNEILQKIMGHYRRTLQNHLRLT